MSIGPIPYGRQSISAADIATVAEVLSGDWVTQGPAVERFEQALAERLGARYAVAVSSGTAALHLACAAAGVSEGDRVITSPNTFVASSTCGVLCGAEPSFVDIDPRTYNIDPDVLDSALGRTSNIGGVLVPVHFAGQPCDMERISDAAARHSLTVIEDACHAIGATWSDQSGQVYRVGDCSHSDMTCFSFHPVKHITTGEGGAILTNRSDLYYRLIRLRSHGITKAPRDWDQPDEGPWYYEMQDLGFNYRITDFQCALGLAQLQKLDGWVEKRRAIASRYDDVLGQVDAIVIPYQAPFSDSSYHLYPVTFTGDAANRRREVFETMRIAGIGVQVHYIPVHLQPYYARTHGFAMGDFPVAESYYERCLSLPIYPDLSRKEQEYVISILLKAIEC